MAGAGAFWALSRAMPAMAIATLAMPSSMGIQSSLRDGLRFFATVRSPPSAGGRCAGRGHELLDGVHGVRGVHGGRLKGETALWRRTASHPVGSTGYPCC